MFFFPVRFFIFAIFIFFLPILFLLGYFHIVTIGFAKLGLSPEATIAILLMMLVGSAINIPLTRKKLAQVERSVFFGLFRKSSVEASGIAINVGGALIPLGLSLYFLRQIPVEPVLIATGLMSIAAYLFSRPVPKRGITISAFILPLFAVVFALLLAPEFAAPTAFVSGVLGILIGADLLKIGGMRRREAGLLSIGGAGVFDGIFLVGIISALLT